MRHRLRGTLHDFLAYLERQAEHPRGDPFYILAEHDLMDLKDTQYWGELKRIAEAHGLEYIGGIAVHSRTGDAQRVDLILTDGRKSVEGYIARDDSGVHTEVGVEKLSPHPDCGPPGWIQGPNDVKNKMALLTKPSCRPWVEKILEGIPIDVYGVGMPGRTSLALLRKYDRVLYLDDLDLCGIKRYLEWKKLICPEYVGIKASWLCDVDYERFRIKNYNQWDLIKDELIPPELEEEARFLAGELIVELEGVLTNIPERVVRAVREKLNPSNA